MIACDKMASDDNIVIVGKVVHCLNNALIALNSGNDDIANLDDNISNDVVCDYVKEKYEIIENDVTQLLSLIKRTNWSK